MPEYEEVSPSERYAVLMADYMHGGGDGYSMLKDTPFESLSEY